MAVGFLTFCIGTKKHGNYQLFLEVQVNAVTWLPKTNSSHLKINAWKTSLSFGSRPIFRGESFGHAQHITLKNKVWQIFDPDAATYRGVIQLSRCVRNVGCGSGRHSPGKIIHRAK